MGATAPVDWLAGLTPGQLVAVYDDSIYYNKVELLRVDRTTATQVVVDGERFRRADGRQVRTGRFATLLPLDHPAAVQAWATMAFRRADMAVDVAFKQCRDRVISIADALRLARQAIEQAEAAQNATSIPEPAPVATEGHDDPPGEGA